MQTEVQLGAAPSDEHGPLSPELVLVSPDLRRLYEQGLLGSGMPADGAYARPAHGEPAKTAIRRCRRLRSRVAGIAAAGAAALLTAAAGDQLPDAPNQASARTVLRATPVARRLAHMRPAAAWRRRRRLASALAPPRRPPAIEVIRSEIEPPSSLLGPLPDPTPPRRRLSPATAKALVAAARRSGLDWATEAALLQLHPRSWRVAGARLAGNRRPAGDLRLAVFARYDRVVGLDALVSGLEGAGPVLGARVLRDPRIRIYPGGQRDIAHGRVDVRVLAVLLFLAQRPGGVTVSSLVSGHARLPDGSPSPHTYGVAVDISGLAGRPVAGNQRRGGTVARAIRSMQLLPPQARPTLILSLLGLGGPSLALADHDRHIEISFDPSPTPTKRGRSLPVLWRAAGAHYRVPWQVLQAINQIESNYGQHIGPSSAGAVGWMQFMPATWARYGLDANGDGRADPANPTDAIFASARYLAAAGGTGNLPAALYAYNHARWYVDDVLRLASTLGASASFTR